MSKLYIRLMTGFYQHRKTARLRATLGNDALWLPPRLWAYCAENQPDGDISGYSPAELAVLIGYPGDASSMLVALKDCGFVTSEGLINGWEEHNGYHQKFSERAKTAAEARWAKKEKNQKKESTEKEESGNRKGETSIATSIHKQCLEHACSIEEGQKPNEMTVSTKARVALHWLNEKAGRHYRETDANLKVIENRLDESEVTLDGVKQMIERMVSMWKGDLKMEEYLRPETLFGKTKFSSYYDNRDLPVPTKQTGSSWQNSNPPVKPDYSKGF